MLSNTILRNVLRFQRRTFGFGVKPSEEKQGCTVDLVYDAPTETNSNINNANVTTVIDTTAVSVKDDDDNANSATPVIDTVVVKDTDNANMRIGPSINTVKKAIAAADSSLPLAAKFKNASSIKNQRKNKKVAAVAAKVEQQQKLYYNDPRCHVPYLLNMTATPDQKTGWLKSIIDFRGSHEIDLVQLEALALFASSHMFAGIRSANGSKVMEINPDDFPDATDTNCDYDFAFKGEGDVVIKFSSRPYWVEKNKSWACDYISIGPRSRKYPHQVQ